MGMQDRDYYRDHHKKRAALESLKLPRSPLRLGGFLKNLLIWIAIMGGLFFAFRYFGGR